MARARMPRAASAAAMARARFLDLGMRVKSPPGPGQRELVGIGARRSGEDLGGEHLVAHEIRRGFAAQDARLGCAASARLSAPNRPSAITRRSAIAFIIAPSGPAPSGERAHAACIARQLVRPA